MVRLRLGLVGALVFGSIVLVGPTASASPKAGCPVGNGWQDTATVEAVASRIWPGLLDRSLWIDEQDFRESAVRPYDRNGDGSICLKIMWGDDLNPNAHWYGVGIDLLGTPTEQFLVRDNTANASNK